MSDFDAEDREHLLREPGMRIRRARRPRPRLPAGTAVVRILSKKAIGCVPESDGSEPTPEHVLAAQLFLRDVIQPILRSAAHGALVENSRLGALESGFHEAFGCAPQTAAWLGAFIRELELGRCAWFAAELTGTEPGPEERKELARVTLRGTRDALASSAPGCELPRWLSVNLTVLLLQKFSFGRGGGPQGALATNSVRDLLKDPVKMIAFLRVKKYRSRMFSAELALLGLEASTKPQDCSGPGVERVG